MINRLKYLNLLRRGKQLAKLSNQDQSNTELARELKELTAAIKKARSWIETFAPYSTELTTTSCGKIFEK